MINLKDTKYGIKRKAIIGVVYFNVINSTMNITYLIQLIDSEGKLLEDKSLRQNMELIYTLSNDNRVDNQFNLVQSGSKGEYQYFMELMQSTPLPSLIIQLGNKLNERGIFN